MFNPFNPKYPMDPEFFANRKEEIKRFERDLKRTLDSKLPENIAILGDWGVGKSSLAYKLAHLAANTKGAKILSTGIGVPRTIKSMDDMCFLLLYKLNQDIASSMNITNKLREEIKKWSIQTLEIGPFGIGRRGEEHPKMPFTQLHSKLVELWQEYLAREGVDAVTIVIDDVHHLVEAVKGGILDLRSVFQDLPRYGCNYQLILTGPKMLFSDVRELAEPMTRFFSTYEIDNMDFDGTKEMIQFPLRKTKTGIRIEEDVLSDIYDKTRGHPYFIAFFMQIILEEANGKIINLPFYEKTVPLIFRELETQKFGKDLRITSDAEKMLLFRISQLPKEEFLLRDVAESKKTVPKLLNRLVEKGIAIKTGRGRYKLYHPLFKEFLKTSHREDR